MARAVVCLAALTVSVRAAIPSDGAVWILRGDGCGEVTVRWSSFDDSFSSASLAAVPAEGVVSTANLSLTPIRANVIQYNASNGYSSPNIWSVPLSRLDPGKRYVLQLWGDAVYTFVVPTCTLPSSAAIDAGSAHALLVVGDIGTTNHSKEVLGAMQDELAARGFAPPYTSGYEMRGSAALLIVGDLSYADGKPTVWDKFQAAASPLLVPAAVLPGNHEFAAKADEATAYRARFGDLAVPPSPPSPQEAACIASLPHGWSSPLRAPVPGSYGAFRSGPFHVVMLCMYGSLGCLKGRSVNAPLGLVQTAWLHQELSCRVDRAVTPFLVIALHPPLYHSSESHRFEPDTMMVRFAIEPLLLSVGVDLVIAGHVHAYEVTQPISHGDVDECDGIVHVTVGTGGNREGLYDNWVTPPPDWANQRESSSYGYSRLEALNRSHFQVSFIGVPSTGPPVYSVTVASHYALFQPGQPCAAPSQDDSDSASASASAPSTATATLSSSASAMPSLSASTSSEPTRVPSSSATSSLLSASSSVSAAAASASSTPSAAPVAADNAASPSDESRRQVFEAALGVTGVVLALGAFGLGVLCVRCQRERQRKSRDQRISAAAEAAVGGSFDNEVGIDLTLDEALEAVDSVHSVGRPGAPSGRASGGRTAGAANTASAHSSSRKTALPKTPAVETTTGAVKPATTVAAKGEDRGGLLAGPPAQAQVGPVAFVEEDEDEDF